MFDSLSITHSGPLWVARWGREEARLLLAPVSTIATGLDRPDRPPGRAPASSLGNRLADLRLRLAADHRADRRLVRRRDVEQPLDLRPIPLLPTLRGPVEDAGELVGADAPLRVIRQLDRPELAPVFVADVAGLVERLPTVPRRDRLEQIGVPVSELLEIADVRHPDEGDQRLDGFRGLAVLLRPLDADRAEEPALPGLDRLGLLVGRGGDRGAAGCHLAVLPSPFRGTFTEETCKESSRLR